MEKIYSESDVSSSGLSWGEWKFTLSEDEIQDRVSSFCTKREIFDPEEERWAYLFSTVQELKSIKNATDEANKTVDTIEETPMDHSTTGDAEDDVNISESTHKCMHDLCSSVVDACSRLVPKLRSDSSSVLAESEEITRDLCELNKENLELVMKTAWCQLESDESKLCFCVMCSSTSPMCLCLCKHVLLPLLSVNQPSKLELLSSILSKEGDIVCVNLIAPLLLKEDSPWVRDIPGLEELMSAMTVNHWTTLLKVLLSEVKDLQEWQIPVLAVVVEKAEPSNQELQLLVQLMSSTSAIFSQNRDFGALVAAVAASLKSESASLAPQLKAIVNNFKGSLKVMKFKTLRIIADITD